MIASGGTALLLERVAYRPLRRRGASRLAALISAIGASFALQEIFAIWVVRRRDPVEVPTLMGQNVLFHLGRGPGHRGRRPGGGHRRRS